ncbi:hypothetical protein DVH24_015412 [Malus domestica]|uniref:RING-type E3 ubiquitin transferase n=1 Tax=Malus domestica TaxID=3750 RepID=A0A498KPP0_MALDO|nr:hypothetical protein DVH24_015412 [Malus domestica]
MDGSEITGEGVNFSPPPSVVGIAISGDKNSKYIVRWALDKFVPEGNVFFKLIHVRPKITGVPTPSKLCFFGLRVAKQVNLIGKSDSYFASTRDVVAAYRKEMEWQASEKLVPYKKMCASRKMQVDVVLVESDDVANAIAEEVAKSAICNLVLGAPSRGIFKRKQNGLSSKISACTPRFCTVYAVSKGKLSSVRASDAESVESVKYENSDTCSVSSSSSNTSSSQTGTDRGSVSSNSHFRSPSLPMQRFQALTNINQTLLSTKKNSNDTIHSRCQSQDLGSFVTDCQSWTSDQASTSDVVTDYSPESQTSQATFNLELEKLRIELRHAKGIYAMAQSETMDASRKIYNLNKLRLEEAVRLKEINSMEEKAIVSATQEKEKYESAKKEADYMRECVKREVAHRREAEMQAMHDAKEKEKLEQALVGPVQQYQKFSWDEIVTSTSSFSEDLKIGMGAYGTVYKGNFHHTTAAVKVLHSIENRQTKQFQQELEILSKIRHPHLLLLLGACPDHSCLVYEYMENGSLEDRKTVHHLFLGLRGPNCLGGRLNSRLSSRTKPKPIIHRDLKPANILLDHNLVSKIGDVGLATMLNSDPSMSSIYSDTGPVGTLSYIDPEYQRTGIISPQSDVYAFGMVILQLLSAKPARAITHLVETAVKDKNLTDVLDPKAGHWPMEETRQLAELGLSCAELRRRDRPDLKEQVVPLLERLKEVADTAKNSAPPVQCLPPNHFICPILKDVMDEPCVAADGYTYDRKAIEKWFEENNNSPMTNLPLPNKDVILNYTLLSAIMETQLLTLIVAPDFIDNFGVFSCFSSTFTARKLEKVSKKMWKKQSRSKRRLWGRGGAGDFSGWEDLTSSNSVKLLRFMRPVCTAKVEDFGEVVRHLGCVRHHNLVPLLGFYAGPRVPMNYKLIDKPLCSMAESNPDSHRWPIIYRISIGIAKGLDHLHTGFEKPIIHGNLKSKNILLDRHYRPFISDFSLHLLLNPTAGQEMLEVSASEGYKAPELIKMRDANEETDIYSLGVVLLELLTGKEPINQNPTTPDEDFSLPNFMRNAVLGHKIHDLFHPDLLLNSGVGVGDGEIPVAREQILKFFQLAMACCAPSPSLRPNTKKVLWKLEDIGRN